MSLIVTHGYGNEEGIQFNNGTQWYAIKIPLEFSLNISKLECFVKVLKAVTTSDIECYVKFISSEFYYKTIQYEFYIKPMRILNNTNNIN